MLNFAIVYSVLIPITCVLVELEMPLPVLSVHCRRCVYSVNVPRSKTLNALMSRTQGASDVFDVSQRQQLRQRLYRRQAYKFLTAVTSHYFPSDVSLSSSLNPNRVSVQAIFFVTGVEITSVRACVFRFALRHTAKLKC